MLIFCHLSFAQDRCGTMLFNESKTGPTQKEIKSQFEDWLNVKMRQKQSVKQGRAQGLQSETIYEIPVVVHIVHSGETYGDAGNIPDEQVLSQITTLNEDFRRMNADQTDTPPSFVPDAADVKVEFVLAKRDPEGLPTNGIVRIVGNQEFYSINQAEDLAANSYWPAEEYLNIWVAKMSGGLLGFAKFPVSNEPGMDEDPNLNRLIDGVYIDYEYFGTGHNADSFSKGRTLTHEVGHWLGLRHIWGDGGCGVDDFCNDTPTQDGSSSGCPAVEETSCSTVDMFQNYMDYTDDVCMNLFTNCQGDRMRTVIENSPRRKELLSSLGTQAVVQVANDLGIRAVLSPTFGNCDLNLQPQVEVKNYGTNDITSFTIEMLADSEVILTEVYSEVLTEFQSIFINLSEIIVSENVDEISFKVKMVNGGVDGNADNDCKSVSTFFPSAQVAPLTEDFEGEEVDILQLWQMKNSNNNPSAWGLGTAPNTIVANKSAVLSYYGAPSGSFGELDYFISPVFDMTELATADLRFKYAYANHSTFLSDALTVVVSIDCGATFPEENILFQKIGANLSTSSSTNSLFVPADPSDWSEIEINFGEFSGEEVVIAFIGSNGGGNNLYLDDIRVFSSAANNYDIGITKVESLPIMTCDEDIKMDIHVKNFGKDTITEFSLSYEFGTRSNTLNVNTTLNLLPGKTKIVEVESFNIENAQYQIEIKVDAPNGQVDENPANNTYTAFFGIDTLTELIPIKQQFTKTLEASDWYFVRPDAPADWTISDFRKDNKSNYALAFKGYEIIELGIENWAVSPILDFTIADEASMTFDVSYANKTGRNDQLRILASTNCGRSYPIELYNKKGGTLAVTQSESDWVPDTTSDWRREFVNLNDLIGVDDVRLAFVVTNQNGNNIYLDNIELFVSDDENPIEITESMRSFPNPASDYIEVKFNFNIKEEILLRVVSLDGEVIAEQSFPNTLNQIYRIEHIKSTSNGMYILQVLGDFTNLSSKILIQK